MNTTYEQNEMKRFANRYKICKSAPLSERKEAQADCLELMKLPHIVARNIDWLLNGDYGHAEKLRAQQIRDAKRGNRAAQMMTLLALLDCNCPDRECIAAWKHLTPAEQEALNTAILSALDESKREQ